MGQKTKNPDPNKASQKMNTSPSQKISEPLQSKPRYHQSFTMDLNSENLRRAIEGIETHRDPHTGKLFGDHPEPKNYQLFVGPNLSSQVEALEVSGVTCEVLPELTGSVWILFYRPGIHTTVVCRPSQKTLASRLYKRVAEVAERADIRDFLGRLVSRPETDGTADQIQAMIQGIAKRFGLSQLEVAKGVNEERQKIETLRLQRLMEYQLVRQKK